MTRIPIVALCAASIALIAGCGGSAAKSTTTAANSPIKVDLSDFKIDPAATKLRAGKVTFDVTNTGKIAHEMVVVRTNKPAGDLAKGRGASEKGSIGEVSGLKTGDTKTLSLDLKPGHYALICNEPGHYKAGMFTDLTVS
jgi:uncharacterized cupredoxin-like copper-binding protein